MSDNYKCAWCGRSFEKSGGARFLTGATMGFSDLGKKYCSKSCEHAAEQSKSPKSSSVSSSRTSYSYKDDIDDDDDDDDIVAEAQAEKIEYELEKQKKVDSSLKPWMFDNNFYSKSSINSITFPNDIEDIEKTIEKIIKAGIEKIKEVLAGKHDAQSVQLGDKSFLKPYHEEFDFVECCFEKSQEGIKKLQRRDESENSKLRNIIADVEDYFAELKDNWFSKLKEHREKKKRKNIIFVSVLFGIIILFFAWAKFH